jgi:hypothetical protein
MSREERRQYQRMMRNAERGPSLPPAARARAERNAARRAQRKQAEAKGAFTRGWLIRTLLIAFLAGFLAFSLQWPEMPRAAYVGTAVGLVVIGLLVAFRLVRRRFAPPAS